MYTIKIDRRYSIKEYYRIRQTKAGYSLQFSDKKDEQLGYICETGMITVYMLRQMDIEDATEIISFQALREE